MKRNHPVRVTTTALVGAAALVAVLVAGCSTGSPAAGEPTTGQSSTPTAPATTASSSNTAASSASSSSAAETDGKPDKKELIAGLSKFYQEQQGLSKEDSGKFAVCMVDEMYEKASAKTLVAMMEGNPAKADTADTTLIAEAGVACAKELA